MNTLIEQTFNRTSLELKRVESEGFNGTTTVLLIEPVWN